MDNNDELKPDDLGTVAKNFINAMKTWQATEDPLLVNLRGIKDFQFVVVANGGVKLLKHK